MIPRYSCADMQHIWSDDFKYKCWFEIELYACEAMAELGLIPANSISTIRDKGYAALNQIDLDAIYKIEAKVKHDVIAFLTWLGEHIGEDSKYVHLGLTSSDVLDSALAIQMRAACELIITDLNEVITNLKARAEEHKNTPCIGRSHGIHAESTTFGRKLLSFVHEFERNLNRFQMAFQDICYISLSGAVGTYSTIDPQVEIHVAKKLNMNIEPVATQVIPRDRHAFLFSAMALIASSIERFAVEIRHLQRTEVREVEEYFSPGQKGSSAMPHKRNPVLSENLTGLARFIRAAIIPALENVALWHERDISHSSVERILLPDCFIALDFALKRLSGLVKNLVVYPERMQQNLELLHGVIHSQKIMLALIQKGLSREEAYALVQQNAMKSWELGLNFLEVLQNDDAITTHLPKDTLNTLCK